MCVNLAQAYKWNGNDKECRAVVSKIDWSAFELKFKLANSVLIEDWQSAAQAMRKLGADEAMQKSYYIEWPLFQEFRKTPECQNTFREIFGEDLKLTEPQSTENSLTGNTTDNETNSNQENLSEALR